MYIRGVHMVADSGEPEAIVAATKVMVSTGNTFAVLPFNPYSICATKGEVEQRMELPEMWGAREEPKKKRHPGAQEFRRVRNNNVSDRGKVPGRAAVW